DDRHTRVTLQLDHEPSGAVEKAGDALGIVQHRVQGDLQNFKEFIESRGREEGGWRGGVGGSPQAPAQRDPADDVPGARPGGGAGPAGVPGEADGAPGAAARPSGGGRSSRSPPAGSPPGSPSPSLGCASGAGRARRSIGIGSTNHSTHSTTTTAEAAVIANGRPTATSSTSSTAPVSVSASAPSPRLNSRCPSCTVSAFRPRRKVMRCTAAGATNRPAVSTDSSSVTT